MRGEAFDTDDSEVGRDGMREMGVCDFLHGRAAAPENADSRVEGADHRSVDSHRFHIRGAYTNLQSAGAPWKSCFETRKVIYGATRILFIESDGGREDQRDILSRPRQNSDMIERVAERKHTRPADASESGLQSRHAAV